MASAARNRRVLLVDDHPVYRDGLKALVETHPELKVVGETDNFGDALELLELVAPDLMITDLRLARSSGHDLIEAALKQRPSLKVVVISIHDQNSEVLRAVQAGASAYLTKGATREEVLRALTEVLEGRKRCGGTAFSSQRNLSYYEEVYSSIGA